MLRLLPNLRVFWLVSGATLVCCLLGCDSASSPANGVAGTAAGGTSSGGASASAAGTTSMVSAGMETGMGGGGMAGAPDMNEGGAAISGAGAGAGAGGAGACAGPPKIMFVVSRAGSMFLGEPAPWDAIRSASLEALEQVESEAELGFLAVTGESDACPVLEEVAPAASGHAAIAAKYNALAAPQKGESPFTYGLHRAGELLTGAGKKYIVFVLNGEADYCSDGFPGCPTDSVIAQIQKLHAAGVTTLIVSAPGLLVAGEERLAAYEAALQGYANAGAGLPVTSHTEPTTLNIMCVAGSDSGAVAWRAELDASGKPDDATLAEYAESGGDAPYVRLESATITDWTSELSTLLEGIATCP